MLIDGHFDMLGDVAKRRKSGESKVIPTRYLPSFRQGGVTGVVASIFVDSLYLPEQALRIAMEQVSSLHCEVAESPDQLMLCTTSKEIYQALVQDKLAILLSFEGAEPLSSALLLQGFYYMGVRGLGLAWSRRNAAADGCDFIPGNEKKGGLSQFGVELLHTAFDLGMLIDISHLSDEGIEDVFSYAKGPIIASHSNCRALANTKRNLTDDHLKKIAQYGGVVGLNTSNIIAANTDADATQEQLIAHIDHMVYMMGEDHVALGFDFCDQFLMDCSPDELQKIPRTPFDIISGHQEIPSFLIKLEEHGYSQNQIEKIAWKNWMRVYEEVF